MVSTIILMMDLKERYSMEMEIVYLDAAFERMDQFLLCLPSFFISFEFDQQQRINDVNGMRIIEIKIH